MQAVWLCTLGLTVADSSNEVSATPSAPTSFTATAGDGQVTLIWLDRDVPQGGTLSNWIINYKKSSVSGWFRSTTTTVEPAAAARSTVVSGLSNGEEYTFRLDFKYLHPNGSTYTNGQPIDVTAMPTAGPGVTISDETLTVTERSSSTYTVVLKTKPGGSATVTPSSDDTGAATYPMRSPSPRPTGKRPRR